MTLTVTHNFTSTTTESSSSGTSGGQGIVGPSEWNANHTLTGTLSTANLTAATTNTFGIVEPDNTTITISSGVISATATSAGGATGNVQFASAASTFSGDGSFTYAGAGGGVTIKLSSSTSTAGISALSIVTSSSSNMASNASALNIQTTWNNSGTTFDAPLFMNITNTASHTDSLLMDLQIGGSTNFAYGLSNTGSPTVWFNPAQFGSATPSDTNYFLLYTQGEMWYNTQSGATGSHQFIFNNGSSTFSVGSIPHRAAVAADGFFGISSVNGDSIQVADVGLSRNTTGLLQLLNPNAKTTATGFQVYNTTDVVTGAPTNYERGVFDWTTSANVLTVGPQSGGTGTFRTMNLIMGGSGNGLINQVAWVGSSNSITFQYFGNTFVTFGNTFVSLGTNVSFGLGSGGVQNWNSDVSLARVAAKVIEFGDGGANANGWMNWAGEARVSANSTTTSTAMANVPGLAFKPQASRNYSFEAHLIFTDAAAGGIQCTVNATSTTTTYTLTFDGWVTDTTAVRGYAQGSAFGNVVASSLTTGTLGHVTITGTLMTSATAPSTVTIQFAQNTSNATATTVLIGSYMRAYDMP